MTDTMTKLILVRHGESNVTVQRLLGGERTCTGLSDLGRQQAERLRDRWAGGGEPEVDVLYASTLPRAMETAEIINPALGHLPIQHEKDLEEHRPGELDGYRFDQIQADFGPVDLRTRPHRPIGPGAETVLEFFDRTARAFEHILHDNVGKTVVVACHGGVIDIAFRHFLDLPRNGMFDLWTLNTSLTEFRVDDTGDRRGRWTLVRYNDHAHLAGLPSETPRAQ